MTARSTSRRLAAHLFGKKESNDGSSRSNDPEAAPTKKTSPQLSLRKKGPSVPLPPVPLQDVQWLLNLYKTIQFFKDHGYFEDEGEYAGTAGDSFTFALTSDSLSVLDCLVSACYQGLQEPEQWCTVSTMLVDVLRWCNRHPDARSFLDNQDYRSHLDSIMSDVRSQLSLPSSRRKAAPAKSTRHEQYLSRILWSFRFGIHHTKSTILSTDTSLFGSTWSRSIFTASQTTLGTINEYEPSLFSLDQSSDYGLTRQCFLDITPEEQADNDNPQAYCVLGNMAGSVHDKAALESYVRDPTDPDNIQYKIHRSPLSPKTWIIDAISPAAIAEMDVPRIFAGVRELVNTSKPWLHSFCTTRDKSRLALEILHCEARLSSGKDFGRRCMSCIRRLSRHLGELPTSLYVHDVVAEGEFPVWGGGFADIWKGKRGDAVVCLKVLRIFQSDESRKQKIFQSFAQEALLWNQLDHPNILPFLGVSVSLFPGRFCLISPWMFHGNVITYLSNTPWHSRKRVVVDIASGLHYLHTRTLSVVHGDLKGVNVLVTLDRRCCLADFGLACIVAQAESLSTNSSHSLRGSARWMAPEMLTYNAPPAKPSTVTDVYAFGCTILEIYTGKPPFLDLSTDIAVSLKVLQGHRPTPPPEDVLPVLLRDLIEECWAQDPGGRPTMSDVLRYLENVNEDVT